MARSLNTLSVPELERLLSEKRSELENLQSKREQLQKQLEGVDNEIAELGGSSRATSAPSAPPARRGRPPGKKAGKKAAKRRGRRRSGRGSNRLSLRDQVTEVLSSNRGGLSLSELSQAVKDAGYKTTSKNFENVVYQCLYNNRDKFAYDSPSGKYTTV